MGEEFQAILDSLKEMQAMNLFSKGGKFTPRLSSSGDIVDPGGKKLDPIKVPLANVEIPKELPAAQEFKQPQGGNFGKATDPTLSSNENSRRKGDPLFNIAAGASVAIPALLGLSNFRNQDKSGLVPQFDEVSFTQPAVKSATAPRFTTRFRRAAGSSLAEREAGLRFADAQNEARRQRFSEFNDRFVLQQRQQNAQIGNREDAINTRIRNQQEGIRANLQNRKLERQQSAGNKLISDAVFNAVGLLNQRGQRKAISDARFYEAAVGSGQLSSDDIRTLGQRLFGIEDPF